MSIVVTVKIIQNIWELIILYYIFFQVLLEELDKDVKEAKFMCENSEKNYGEIARRLGVMEEELRRAIERADLADQKNISLEEQLRNVGENMKALEVAEEKALEREEKFKEQIRYG